MSTYVPQAAEYEPREKLVIKEKTVGSISGTKNDSGNVSFKKRKAGTRQIRSRDATSWHQQRTDDCLWWRRWTLMSTTCSILLDVLRLFRQCWEREKKIHEWHGWKDLSIQQSSKELFYIYVSDKRKKYRDIAFACIFILKGEGLSGIG